MHLWTGKMLSFILFSILLTIFYLYFTWNFDYWRKKKVFGPTPLPFFGNYPKSAVLLTNIIYEQQNLYEQYKKEHRFIGVFERRSPKLLVLDPELVSDIYVKLFKHFQLNDSSSSFDAKLDPIFVRNLFTVPYDEWRNLRTELSAGFSPNKLRKKFPMIVNSGRKMIERVDNRIGSRRQQIIDVKNLTSRFTADTVMNCVYGLEADEAVHSQLVEWFKPSLLKNLANATLSTFSILSCIYKPSFFPPQFTHWLYDTFEFAVKNRDHNGNQTDRIDFLNFLLERKQSKNHSNEDLAAFAAMFLFDGFETSSMILAQALYHIAKNQHCQTELRAEILEHSPSATCLTTDTISEMQYLDNIVNETVRIGPSAFLLAKKCTQPIELCDFDGRKFVVEPGTSIQLPIYAIHHDERFYEDPNSFRPERFQSATVNELKKRGHFLPFGDGPRQCIAVVEIVRHYYIRVNSMTTEPVIASSLDSLLTPITDIHLDFQLIDEKPQ